MSALPSIIIDDTPANVATMLARGFFHSHQDGRWRYSPFGGETAHCNDPTARFELHESFPNDRAASADPASGLVARVYRDGTRSVNRWDRAQQNVLDHLYGPADAGDKASRDWLLRVMP